MPNTPLKGDYNTYIGARYVPIIGGMWNQQTEYEPLTIVMYQGSSYTSKTFVPKGTQIDNTTYWVRTANYDEQVEFYRSEVQQFKKDIDTSEAEYIASVKQAQEEFTSTTNKNIEQFKTETTNSQNTFQNQINSNYSALQNQVNALVLSAGNPDSSSAELVQARATWDYTFSTLADRLNNGVINTTANRLNDEATSTTDWNDLPVNYIVLFGHSGTTTDLHAPINDFQGNVITFCATRSNVFKTQIAILDIGNYGVPRIYVRNYFNAWTAWYTVAYNETLENYTNIYTNIYIKYHSGSISAFPRFGVIGDSYASGEVYSSDLKGKDNYWLSWGQQLARTLGNTCENYSQGGCTSAWWFTNMSAKCYTKFQNDEPCDLYLIAMGINDPNRSSTKTIGTIDDIKNGDDNADTFYGQYGRLIQTCKTKNNNALIVCLKTMQINQDTNYNNAIAEIASHFGVPVINPLDHPYFHSKGFTSMVSGHPTAFDYGAIGNAVNELFSECTLNNDDYFKNWGYNTLTNGN